jgi:type II secretory pathway component GspD/PulD (secretin)
MAANPENDRMVPMRTILCAALLLAACQTTSQSSRPTPASGDEMRVVPLRYASADETASELNRLVAAGHAGSTDADSANVIVADPRTNSVLVKASSADMPHILELIAKLDQKVEAQAK